VGDGLDHQNANGIAALGDATRDDQSLNDRSVGNVRAFATCQSYLVWTCPRANDTSRILRDGSMTKLYFMTL
jgi:hypothetical protein